MYAATIVALCRYQDSLCGYRELPANIADCFPGAGHSHLLLGVSPPDATEAVGASDRQGLVVLAVIQADSPASFYQGMTGHKDGKNSVASGMCLSVLHYYAIRCGQILSSS